MPIPTGRFYSPDKLHWWFAVSSILMAASIIWMIQVDYARPWREFQDGHFNNKAALAHFDYLEATRPQRVEELEQARVKLGELKRSRDEVHGSERRRHVADLAKARIEFAKAESPWSRAVQLLEVSRDQFERARERYGPDSPVAAAAREAYRDDETAAEELRKRKEHWGDEVERLQGLIKEIDAPVAAVERRVRQLERIRDEALTSDRQYRGVLTDAGWLAGVAILRSIINFPLFDFVAPKNTPGRHQVNQLVLPGVRQRLNYVETYTTERCTTCHIAIDDPKFTEADLARTLERALPAINEVLERMALPPRPFPDAPNVEGDGVPALEVGHVTDHWDRLDRGRRKAYLAALLETVNDGLELSGRKRLRFEQPLLAHPDPDLFVSADSWHPMAAVGCTACHEGNPQETDFVLAAHTPPDSGVACEWKDKYYVRRLGITGATFESVSRRWDRPMLPLSYVEASCAKCHTRISDASRFARRGHGSRLDLGRHLFTAVGCVNCHSVDTFPDARRVGPDLTAVASKLTPQFVRQWIPAPQRLRPSTRMPHFFGQENNRADAADDLDPDPALRTETEVAAITKYLFAVSDSVDLLGVPEGVEGKVSWGRELFKSVGCLACHANIAEFGERWVTRDLIRREGLGRKDALARCRAMSYEQQIRYAMRHFTNELDTMVGHDDLAVEARQSDTGPIFTRFAPELSGIGSKVTFAWLYSWLMDPGRFSPETKMPSLRLTPAAAAHIASYLATLKIETFDREEPDPDDGHRRMAGQLLQTILSSQFSSTQTRAIMQDQDGQLTEMLLAGLRESLGEKRARMVITSMNLEDKGMFLLGRKMIGHYGCYACHKIHGFEGMTRPGTDLSDWADKPVSRLDFAFFAPGFDDLRMARPDVFDRVYPPDAEELIHRSPGGNPKTHIVLSRASFARHKLLNPRIWDRMRRRTPIEKLKMPNFYLSHSEADALVTFLLSRRSARVSEELQVNYRDTPAGMICDGKELTREHNCIGCHTIDGNAAVIHQYFRHGAGGNVEFDALGAPPSLHGVGAKVQSSWLYGFLDEVETVRPWLAIRMPSFHLDHEEKVGLARYFAGLSRDESGWIGAKLAPVLKYVGHPQETATPIPREADASSGRSLDDVEDRRTPAGAEWFEQDSLADATEDLRRYAVANRLISSEEIDPARKGSVAYAAAHDAIIRHVENLRRLYDVTYPTMDVPSTAISPERIADGKAIVASLNCFACHVFTDPRAPAAVGRGLAPNLQPAYRRLRREWVHAYLEKPRRMLPHTYMPDLFGENCTSPFPGWSPTYRDRLVTGLHDESILTDCPRVIEAMTDFLFDAGAKWRSDVPLSEDSRKPCSGTPLSSPLVKGGKRGVTRYEKTENAMAPEPRGAPGPRGAH